LAGEAPRKRILVVEDDAAIRTMEERVLQAAGYEVRSAGNGSEGLDLARKDPYDLFLLDIMMPGMNGLELARELRKDNATAATPILFATARGEPQDVREGFASGATLYLIKPFTTTTLLSMVRAAVGP
jgi:two-component system phosphate regulon response regulator PhoB